MSRPPVEVRRACVDDLEDLLLLWSQSREELSRSLRSLGAVPVDQLRPRLRESLAAGEPTVVLARYEGAPAGYAVLRLAPVLAVDAAALHIDHLYVLPALRRHGVGRALLTVVTGIAERNGADQVLAGAPPTARDSHRFLARLGFSPLVVRRVVGTATLRRRLAGEGQRRGLEDLLSRRRSLRARAVRAGWPGTGWASAAGDEDDDVETPVVEAAAGTAEPCVAVAPAAPGAQPGERGVPRTGPIVIADCVVQRIDLGPLEADRLEPAPSEALVPPAAPGCPEVTEPVPGQGRRRQRA